MVKYLVRRSHVARQLAVSQGVATDARGQEIAWVAERKEHKRMSHKGNSWIGELEG